MFQFNLTINMAAIEVGSGDSFDVKPVVYNDATEEMYVFIQVDVPTTADGTLTGYPIDTDHNQTWFVVEDCENRLLNIAERRM